MTTELATRPKQLVPSLLVEMRDHIGFENKISGQSLFKEVYGKDHKEYKDLQKFFMWDLIRKSLHWCRKNTKMFVVSKHVKNKMGVQWYFWVAKDITDYYMYKGQLKKIRDAMDIMEKRCLNAVKERWHDEQWNETND